MTTALARSAGSGPVRAVSNTWWRLVFWWKRGTGWVDLGRVVTAVGTVIEVDLPGPDGDGNFDIVLDPNQTWLITGFGGRLTSCPPIYRPALHCEVEPWAGDYLAAMFRRLRIGDRVQVTGRWGFDGVHTGRAMWLEILLALVRHGPNIRQGWFEIHPVETLEILP